MRRIAELPISFLFILVAVTCTVGALISGFVFEVEVWLLALIWLVTALALPVSSLFLRGKGALALMVPYLALVLWRLPEIANGAKGVISFITFEYSKWLYVPILFEGIEATAREITLFFTVIGVVLAFLLYFAICVRRNAMLAILFTAPLIFLTFVLIFHQPNPVFLVGILAVYLTMLIGRSLYPKEIVENGRRTFTALALAALVLLIAYIIVPAGSYSRSENLDSLDIMIRNFAERTGLARVKMGIGWPDTSADGSWRFNTTNVGVADAGVRVIHDRSVIEITASRPGTYYLRGYAMQHFDGRTWSVNADTVLSINNLEEALARGMPALLTSAYIRATHEEPPPEASFFIEGAGDASRGLVYTPYYALPFRHITESYGFSFHNPDRGILELAATLPEDALSANLSSFNAHVSSRETYLQIDEHTAVELRRMATDAGINPNASRAEIADAVARFIMSSGRYTLSPYVIPEGENFTLYFLKTSRQGYCIHFTTAATLMLRALDVPARFTSGFVVTIPQAITNQALVVTDRYAHAWVEVYYDDVGWLFLEVTPPSTGTGIPDGRPHAHGTGIGSEFDGGFDDYFDDYYDDWMFDDMMEGAANLSPGSAGAAGRQPSTVPVVLRVWLPVVLIAVALVATLIFRRRFMRNNRAWRFAQEDTNAAVISVWRHITRLSRRKNPPDEIETIALKARFSQHRISEEERTDVVGYATRLEGEISSGDMLGRLWLKWGLGV